MLRDDLVVVSMPVWNVPTTLVRRALESILGGTHRHVQVVVVGDGLKGELGSELATDGRVVLHHCTRNQGPYFRHDVALRASAATLFAIQDADDESDPRRFSSLLDIIFRAPADAVFSAVRNVNGPATSVSVPKMHVDARFAHRAEHFALYNRDSLLRLGGYFGGARVGFDTLITSSLMLLGKTSSTNDVLYTRHQRDGSLTTSAASGFGSPLRRATAERLKKIWSDVYALSSNRDSAIRKHRDLIQIAARGSDPGTQKAVREIRGLLGSSDRPPASKGLVSAVINAAPTSSWSISSRLAEKLYRTCEKRKPKTILDVGSGLSTMVLALYAGRTPGTKLISLEHDPKWYSETKSALASAGLLDAVDLRLVSLKGYADCTWYDFDPSAFGGPIDLVFVDGPPEAVSGREGALLRTDPFLKEGSVLWMHDGKRVKERAAVDLWKKKRSLAAVLVTDCDPRGVWEIRIT